LSYPVYKETHTDRDRHTDGRTRFHNPLVHIAMQSTKNNNKMIEWRAKPSNIFRPLCSKWM